LLEIIKNRLQQNNVFVRTLDNESDLDNLDVLFVLGGDGTILNVAAECGKRDIKIIGVNYGHVGFLAEFNPDHITDAIDLVCSDNYCLNKRSMLEISIGDETYLALNDLVIQRSTSGRMFSNTVSLRAEIDGSTVDNFSSDGIIISTPTGSTAYSLAAGGSILAPGINAFILTPICPHTLHSRPIVFSDKCTVKINSLRKNSQFNLIVDGKVVLRTDSTQTVTIKKSEKFVTFITKNEGDFYNKLLQKLYIWSK